MNLYLRSQPLPLAASVPSAIDSPAEHLWELLVQTSHQQWTLQASQTLVSEVFPFQVYQHVHPPKNMLTCPLRRAVLNPRKRRKSSPMFVLPLPYGSPCQSVVVLSRSNLSLSRRRSSTSMHPQRAMSLLSPRSMTSIQCRHPLQRLEVGRGRSSSTNIRRRKITRLSFVKENMCTVSICWMRIGGWAQMSRARQASS